MCSGPALEALGFSRRCSCIQTGDGVFLQGEGGVTAPWGWGADASASADCELLSPRHAGGLEGAVPAPCPPPLQHNYNSPWDSPWVPVGPRAGNSSLLLSPAPSRSAVGVRKGGAEAGVAGGRGSRGGSFPRGKGSRLQARRLCLLRPLGAVSALLPPASLILLRIDRCCGEYCRCSFFPSCHHPVCPWVMHMSSLVHLPLPLPSGVSVCSPPLPSVVWVHFQEGP